MIFHRYIPVRRTLALSKMKKLIVFLAVTVPMTFLVTSLSFPGTDAHISYKPLQDSVKYKDGTYEGQSRASYTDEPYWGIVHFTLKNGHFTDISFMVRDTNLHETFDAKYEKHFEGNPEYIKQSRNDWNGVQAYPKKLAEKQDLNKVDAMSGATWSYNIFRATVQEALKKAK
jgi:major membrane immunogen (membrane-anchored lipoprotein)